MESCRVESSPTLGSFMLLSLDMARAVQGGAANDGKVLGIRFFISPSTTATTSKLHATIYNCEKQSSLPRNGVEPSSLHCQERICNLRTFPAMAAEFGTSVADVPSKSKKDKSNKKSKVVVTEETSVSRTADPAAPKVKKSKSSKKIKTEAGGVESIATSKVVEVAETTEPKAHKSSKKRKVVAEGEEPVAASEAVPGPKIKKEKSNQNGRDAESTSAIPDITMADVEPEPVSTEPPTKKRKLSVDEIEVDITAPEPPSKKALRALKKGKPLPPSKSGAEPKPATEAKKSEQDKKSEHGVWIGNLAFSVSKDDLRKFFVEYSDITEDMITRIHMPGPDDHKPANRVAPRTFGKVVHNKGFAYVDFSTAEGVKLAIEISEQLLTGRRVLIKDNKSYEGRPEKTKEEQRAEGKPPNKRIFVGNLRFDVTEESLMEHFAKCGAIESVKVATFEDSGKCKGYGWITFESLKSSEYAVRGFVYVEQEVSDEEDSDEEDDVENGESEAEDAKPKPKKMKMRKFWINKIMGRPLKVEYAEDAQVRYKKRYGKEGTKRNVDGASGEEVRETRRHAKEAPTPIAYDLPYGGAHLTGGIVASTGKKTQF